MQIPPLMCNVEKNWVSGIYISGNRVSGGPSVLAVGPVSLVMLVLCADHNQ